LTIAIIVNTIADFFYWLTNYGLFNWWLFKYFREPAKSSFFHWALTRSFPLIASMESSLPDSRTKSLFPTSLLRFSEAVRLHYITVVVLCVILVFTFILLYFTIKLSQLREDVRKLAQAIALQQDEYLSPLKYFLSSSFLALPHPPARTGRVQLFKEHFNFFRCR